MSKSRCKVPLVESLARRTLLPLVGRRVIVVSGQRVAALVGSG